MDENYDVQEVDVKDTTPEALPEENQNIEDYDDIAVTPNGEFSSVENVVRGAETEAQKSASENQIAAEPFVSVQYNHKNRNFTKEEAIKYIQKGMHTENLRAKLEYLAKQQGTDVNSLVEGIVSAPEALYRKHLEELYGKDSPDVEIGMQIYRQKQSSEYKKLIADSENDKSQNEKYRSVNSRLAEEYLNLRSEMPDAPEYSELPDSVIIEAAEGKRDLYSAYLCYLHKERKKVAAAEKTQAAASTASSGKMGIGTEDDMTSSDRNFLRGLWQK